MTRNTIMRRVAAVLGTSALLLLGFAGTASAHVSANVYGDQPEQGGYGAVVLRVPNEEPDAGTVKVQLSLPTEYGITSARTKPVAGWTAQIQKKTLDAPVTNGAGDQVREVVTGITWTAEQGQEIAAGTTEYQEFAVSLGRLPSNIDTLLLPTAQTYDSGKVVRWDQPPAPDGSEPEHPAPNVRLAAASEHGHGGAGEQGKAKPAEGASDGSAGSGDSTARWLGGAGLVVGALGLGLGAGATLRARKAVATAKENS